jgi:hypothetical protein
MNAILSTQYPIIGGATYVHNTDGTEAVLDECNISEDFFRLKDPESPWVFESNYATFSYWWKLKD